MGWLIDTNIAIYFRDGEASILQRLAALDSPPEISIITRVELENGLYRDPARIAARRAGLNSFLPQMRVHDFAGPAFDAYARIVAATTYSRPKILDRMIAATAIANDLTLVTINADDFRDIPGLSLTVWPAPPQ